MIVLHQFEISPFCDKVRRILHWKRQPYRVVEVPPSRARGIRRQNPAGKLPFIEHDGRVICDSTEIAHYLERAFPEPPLVPGDPAERALCHLLEDWADESLYFYEMRLRFTLPHNARRWLPELLRSESPLTRGLLAAAVPRMMRGVLARQGIGRKSTEQVLLDVERDVDAIDGLLSAGDWLVGGALSLADIAVFAQLHCIRGAQEGERSVRTRPRVRDWMERVDRATAAPASEPRSGSFQRIEA